MTDNTAPRKSHVTGKRKIVAQILRALSRFRTDNYHGPIRSIAIIMAGRYGDSILLTKLLKQLKAALPNTSIHIITSRKNTEEFFRYSPYVSSTFCLKNGIGSYLKFIISHRYDVLFNPKDAPSTSNLLLSTLLRARIKVSHLHEYHTDIFDRLIALEPLSHVTVQNAGLLEMLGINAEKYADILPEMPHYPISSAIKEFRKAIEGRNCIGINLSAGNASRYWTREKWEELIRLFPDDKFIVFASGQDWNDKMHLETTLGNVIASPETTNLGEVGVIVEKLQLLVSPDTSLVHIAACYDTPVIALFPNHLVSMKGYAPLSAKGTIVASETERVSDIPVDVLTTAVRKLFIINTMTPSLKTRHLYK